MQFFLIISIPLYFNIKYFPLIAFALNFSNILNIRLNIKKLIYIFIFLLLIIFQFSLIDIKNDVTFIYKILAILIFYISFEYGYQILNLNHYKWFKIQFYIVTCYAILSSPSYLLGYNYLLPSFNCPQTNLSEIGLLRCSTFGEGNLYGIYLILSGLLFYKSIKLLLICFICSIIAFSPIPIGILGILILSKKFNTARIINIVIIALLIMLLIIYLYGKNYEYSETSSFGERLEFIKIGITMFIENPIFGVGFGQYGENISEYTKFTHIIEKANEGFRYIPNNVIIEVLSEQGLFGLILFIVFFINTFKFSNHFPFSFLLLISYLSFFQACPSLYTLFIGIFMGYIKKINSIL
jgi:O-antigen ligase